MNGTLITFNGSEYTLQNDFGNAIVETTKLKPGFIPIGLNSYGGIIYVVSHNPLTGESEFGSFPSPERNIDPDNFESTDPTSGVTGLYEQTISNNSFYDADNNIIQLVRRDLMNIDNFQLSSGDKFAVYIVDKTSATNLLNNIDTIFDFKIANVNNGALSYLDSFDLFTKDEISFDESVSGKAIKYNVYSESSTGKLAIIVKLKTIDYFNLIVQETTDVKDITNKTVIVNAKSSTSCNIKCKGFQLNIYKPSNNNQLIFTKYIYSNSGEISNVTLQLKGFTEDEEYLFEAIPYTQFQLYDSEEFIQFKKTQTITIGKDNSGVPAGMTYYTDLYKYYVDTDHIMMDFNLKMRTSGQISKAYIEFYDPYADVSTIREVSNFDLRGQNTIRIEALSEDTKDDDYGGISSDNVGIFDESNSGGVQVILSKDKRYRKDGMLKLNHFYIVRISLVEVIQNTDGITSTFYHDLYKTIVTDQLLNSRYNDNTVSTYDILPRNLSNPIYTKTESLLNTETSTNNEYLNDYTIVNDQIFMYSIYNSEEGPDSTAFSYRLSQNDKYTESVEYSFDINNSIIGKLNTSAISLSGYGLDNPTLTKTQTPSVSGTKYKTNLDALRTTTFEYDGNYSLDTTYNNPKININLKTTTSRVSYGEAVKTLKAYDGFRKVYMSYKLSPSILNGRADMEIGGIAKYVGTGKYTGQSGGDNQESEINIRRNMDPDLHSDNFNIPINKNTDFKQGTNWVDYYLTEYGSGDSYYVKYGVEKLNWPKYQSFVSKYINIKGASPEYAYRTDIDAATQFVNKQKFIYTFPAAINADSINGYVILPIKANTFYELKQKIVKLAGSIYFAIPSSGNASTYYMNTGDFSYDLQYETKFTFNTFGITCSLTNVPAFKFRFKDSGIFSIKDLSLSVVQTWLNSNAVTTGRNIVNPTFANILSTPRISKTRFNLDSPSVSISVNLSNNSTITDRYSSSLEDLNNDSFWTNDKDIVSDSINTTAKQYDPILQYFKFDKDTESFYYAGKYRYAWSANCKYSYNGDYDHNRRRTVGMAEDLLTANFDV